MTITIQKLLQKMEQELKEAKASASQSEIREKIQAIKTLCELVLEEPVKERTVTEKSAPIAKPPMSSIITQPLKVEDDEANGDSLFDF
ncbi:YwdI family protein [Neobacillus sp. LXY-4]|uniref:YwdI family protein n=1 Tax=Neobacillus sp. LXY-4 TaxID=3379826 RepID=UPI003EE1A358